MKGFKHSPLCSNCGRNKRQVTPSLAPSEGGGYSGWLKLPFCEECAHKKCQDCSERRMVEVQGEHPARYRNYCKKHWAIYALCPQCHSPKEVWMPACWPCHTKAEALRLKKLALLQRKRERVQKRETKRNARKVRLNRKINAVLQLQSTAKGCSQPSANTKKELKQ